MYGKLTEDPTTVAASGWNSFVGRKEGEGGGEEEGGGFGSPPSLEMWEFAFLFVDLFNGQGSQTAIHQQTTCR